MNKILIAVSGVAIVALIVTGIAIARPINIKVELPGENIEQFGSVGFDVYHSLNVHGAFNWGGKSFATTTTSTAETIAGSDLVNYDYWDVMSNKGALSYTLPATSTMISILPDVGNTRRWLFHNATSSSGITLTLVKGTGMDLIAVTNADDVIDPGEWTQLTCTHIYYRSADNEDIMCIVDELANAD